VTNHSMEVSWNPLISEDQDLAKWVAECDGISLYTLTELLMLGGSWQAQFKHNCFWYSCPRWLLSYRERNRKDRTSSI